MKKRQTFVKTPAYVEQLVVADVSIYNGQAYSAQTDDTNVVFENMRIYFAHITNGVSIYNYYFKRLIL